MDRACRLTASPLGRLAAAMCVAALAGCTICPDPFDYSGPVPNGSAPQNDFRARSGGILPLSASPKPWPPIVKGKQRRSKPGAEGRGESREIVVDWKREPTLAVAGVTTPTVIAEADDAAETPVSVLVAKADPASPATPPARVDVVGDAEPATPDAESESGTATRQEDIAEPVVAASAEESEDETESAASPEEPAAVVTPAPLAETPGWRPKQR
jgi:hypothetical protein